MHFFPGPYEADLRHPQTLVRIRPATRAGRGGCCRPDDRDERVPAREDIRSLRLERGQRPGIAQDHAGAAPSASPVSVGQVLVVVAAQVCRAVQGAEEHGQVLRQGRDLIINRSLPGRPLVGAHSAGLTGGRARTLPNAVAACWLPVLATRGGVPVGLSGRACSRGWAIWLACAS